MSDLIHLQLKNGINLLGKVNRANPTVSIQLSIAAGPAGDPKGKYGLASFARALLTISSEILAR